MAIVHGTKSGVCYIAPVGTTLPAEYDDTLDTDFVSLGEIFEDGIEESLSKDKTKVKNIGGKVVATLEGSTEFSFKLVLLDTLNPTVQAFFYGTDVVSDADGDHILVGADEDPTLAMVIEVFLSNSETVRYVMSQTEISDRGSITHKAGEPERFEVTVDALYDSTLAYACDIQRASSTPVVVPGP